MSAIEVRELRKTYRGGVEALRGISFSVDPGEVFGLLGPNGAGKSTTVKILTTLSAPTGGSAAVAGFDVLRQPEEVRRRIGCVAQASGVDLTATGHENMTLQGRLFRVPSRDLGRRVDDLLGLFGLTDAAGRLVSTYSGGMRRRLDVAMALIHRPEILFLDEPTTGLDPEGRAALWGEVGRLAREGLTILLTTHYLEEADRLARRLAVVDGGRVVAAGTPDELKGQLRGDRVTVEFADVERAAAAESVLRAIPEAADVARDGAMVIVHVENGTRSIPSIVGALERAGIDAAQVSISRPSLDDVYLAATGHVFRDGAPVAR